jgi:hypothetical protein
MSMKIWMQQKHWLLRFVYPIMADTHIRGYLVDALNAISMTCMYAPATR